MGRGVSRKIPNRVLEERVGSLPGGRSAAMAESLYSPSWT